MAMKWDVSNDALALINGYGYCIPYSFGLIFQVFILIFFFYDPRYEIFSPWNPWITTSALF